MESFNILLEQLKQAEKDRQKFFSFSLNESLGNAKKNSLCPSTFSQYFYNKSNNISNTKIANKDLWTIFSFPSNKKYDKTWIFDADDTLWEDNYYFELIIKNFIQLLIEEGVTQSAQALRHMLDNIEKDVISQFGFGPKSFHLSLEKMLADLQDTCNIKTEKIKLLLDSVIPILTHLPHKVLEETISTLSILKEKGDGLLLYTKGHFETQFSKIARSQLCHLFDGAAIVKDKTSKRLQEFIKLIPFETGQCTSVGNSLRSDILPALEIGIDAIYFDNPNSWHLENTQIPQKFNYETISSLTELID